MEVSCQLYAPAALPRDNNPDTHWMGGWVGLRAGPDAVVKREYPITALAENWTLGVQPIA
jgi:hypothetical protein